MTQSLSTFVRQKLGFPGKTTQETQSYHCKVECDWETFHTKVCEMVERLAGTPYIADVLKLEDDQVHIIFDEDEFGLYHGLIASKSTFIAAGAYAIYRP